MLRKLSQHDPALADVLALIRTSFAYMDGRIAPPSSIHALSLADLSNATREGEVWVYDTPVAACIVLTPKSDCLYLGKLAVAPARRGQKLAQLLVDRAAISAKARGLAALELQVRVELTENHLAFARMGFTEVARTAHAGFDRPTSITMRRHL